MSKSNKSLLVVDDEPYILKSLQRALEHAYQVNTALGAQAALDLLTKQNLHTDIILCDISMPVIDGADFYRLISEKFPGLESRIIFMSGGAYTDDLKRFIISTKNRLIEKPFDHEELLRLIDQVAGI